MKEVNYTSYTKLNFTMIAIGKNKKPIKSRRSENQYVSEKNINYSKDIIYGAVIPKGILVIDIDVKKGDGLASFMDLLADCDINIGELEPTVKTGSGGIHYYFKTDLCYKTTSKFYKHIDFLSAKLNPSIVPPFVVAGDQSLDNGDYVMLSDQLHINANIDKKLGGVLELQVLGDKVTHSNDMDIIDVDQDTIENAEKLKATIKYSKSEVKAILAWCDGSSYDSWMRICATLKRLDSKKMFKVFHNFSKLQDGYKGKDDVLSKWNNIGSYHGNAVTMGTYIREALLSKAQHIELKILNSKDEASLMSAIYNQQSFPYIADKELVKQLTKSFKKQSKKLKLNLDCKSIVEVGLQEKRKDVLKRAKKERSEKIKNNEPLEDEFLDAIYYVLSAKTCKYYYKNHGYDELSLQGVLVDEFKSINTKEWKVLHNLSIRDNVKITPSTCVAHGLIKSVHDMIYNPKSDKKVFYSPSIGNCYNTYRPELRPQPSKKISTDGYKAIEALIAHYTRLYADVEVSVMFDYMAYLAQNFGKRIDWTLVIQGGHGIGKTMLADIMRNNVIGEQNSSIISPDLVASSFSDWASKGVFSVMDEIRLEGQNRFAILNKLKPFITNDEVSINRKGKVKIDVKNNTSYLILTNYSDAIPKTDDTRRWYRMFSRLGTDDKAFERLLAELGYKNGKEYFTLIARLKKDLGADFHRWLLDRNIDTFNPYNRPKSMGSDEMLDRVELDKHAELDELSFFIKEYLNDTHTLSVRLVQHAMAIVTISKDSANLAWSGEIPDTKTLNTSLKKLNFKNHRRIDKMIDKIRYREMILVKSNCRYAPKRLVKLIQKFHFNK